jgi:hypothetical protein
MRRAEAERLERLILREVQAGFGAAAVAGVSVLGDDDDPAMPPGELLVRLLIPATGGDDPQVRLDAWAAAHEGGMRWLRRDLSLRLPPAPMLEIAVAGAEPDGPRIALPHDPALAAEPIPAREAAEIIAVLMRTAYVLPERGERAAAAIEARLAAGEYDGLADEALAERLTSELFEICADRHLRVRARPPHRDAGPGEPVPGGPSPGEPGPGEPSPGEPGPGEPSPGDRGPGPRRPGGRPMEPAGSRARRGGRPRPGGGRLINYGIYRVERLAGNVGYVDLRGVAEPGEAAPAIAAAMELVARTYALIIDLRENGGGSLEGAAFWCSYLFPDSQTHLNDVYFADTGETRQVWSMPWVPGERYTGRPVYVLTSSRTFSGGEDIAYNLQAQGRARVVGEITGGGAHPTRTRPISATLAVSLPYARSVNPVTGTNWEGTGVIPDIAVPADQARDVAYSLALRETLADPEVTEEMPPRLAAEAREALAALPEPALPEPALPEPPAG